MSDLCHDIIRPDISWIVTKLAQYSQKPTVDRWAAVKHVFRYLKGTLDYKLCFQKYDDCLTLTGFSDADWGGSEDRKSTSGYCFLLNKNGGVISWKCRKQPTVALSTCEAEYIATIVAIQEAKFLTQLLNKIDVEKVESGTLFVDNQGTIATAKDRIGNHRTKHTGIKYHFIRSEIKNGSIAMNYNVPSEKNMADVFTKPMTKGKSSTLSKNIMGCRW